MDGSPDSSGSPIRPGGSFGDLEVLEQIGRGAFSVVYRAHDTLIDRPVALKVLDSSRWSDHETARDEILKEARMVARVLDPHVVTLYQVRALPEDRWAFEMEYLSGGSLGDRLKREGRLDPAEAQRVLEAVLRGLHAAHAHGIVHHDVKPGNVLLGRNGAVKLTDFGLGRFVAEDGLARRSRRRPGGTPYYMAPEVIMGRPGEQVSDLWSVGVLLYRMLSGRIPFPARSIESLFLAILNATPAPLPEDTPPLLASVALRCLAKDPAGRPASAAALLEELTQRGGARGVAIVDPAIAGGPSAVLAGRDRELSVLRERLHEAEEGQGRTVLVLGEMGIGKTALVQELGREARISGFRWVEVRMSPLEGLRRPLAQALRETVVGSDEPSDSSRTPHPSSSSRGQELLRRLRDEESSAPDALPFQSAWEIEQVLFALAASRPLAVLLEDVHLCDADELKMLAALGSGIRTAPVFLALTYRTRDPSGSESSDGLPSGYYDLAAAPDVERLELDPLGDRAVRTLLEQASGVPVLPLELVERVIRDSDGVPLYALELFRHLQGAGEIERHADGMRITKRWGRTDLPRPLLDMVRRRLAGVGEEERTLLETAAVAGVTFDGAQLAGVMGLPLLGVLRTLQRLYRDRALVVPLKRGYRFGHALYQEAIYKETAPDLRRALHRAWAEVLEPQGAAEVGDPEALGWHWEQGGEPERAVPYLKQAARAAGRRSENARAWRLAERAGVLREDAAPEVLHEDFELLISLASTFTSPDDASRAEALYERLRAAADALEDPEMRRRVVVAESWHRAQHARGGEVDRLALEDAAASLESARDQANAWWLLGRMHAVEGEFEKARAALERASAAYRASDEAARGAQLSLHTLASILQQECRFEEAEARFARLADLTIRTSGKTPQAAISRASAILAAARAGRIQGAGEALDEPIRWLEQADQAARAGQTLTEQAQLYEAEGRIQDARTALRRAEQHLREAVLGSARWSWLRLKARVLIARGELESAAATLDEAAEAAGNLPPVDLAALDEERAFLLVVLGDHDEAAARLIRALEQVAPTPYRLDLGRLLVELIHLAGLGLDLSAALPTIRRLDAEDPDPPPLIELTLRIAEGALRTDVGASDAPALERAAAAARDPRLGLRQASMGVVASLLSARANLLGGELDAADSLLLASRRRAQQLEHVWLELRALQLARDGELDVDPFRVSALVEDLKARNPADADRMAAVIASWTSGMPRA